MEPADDSDFRPVHALDSGCGAETDFMRAATSVVTAVVMAAAIGTAAAQTPSGAEGAWSGRVVLPASPLVVFVVLSEDAATHTWSGTVDIPAQGAKGLKLVDVTVDGSAVAFTIAGIPGGPTFKGTLAGDAITGTFTQGANSFPFELRRGAPAPVVRPQEPKPPFPYKQESVSYRNTVANINLAGTLTRPDGSARVPAVLLITGSGSQDRDETIEGHKPFLLIADTLTRRGLAVLRVDDRGIGGSDRGSIVPTTADLAGDVKSGLAYLRGRQDIDSSRIGLIGHSEGANIAAMVAADEPAAVHFVVMLAGIGIRGDAVLLEQAETALRAMNAPPAAIQWDRELRQRVFAILNAEVGGVPNAAAREAFLASVTPPPGQANPAAARANAQALLTVGSSPWLRFFISYEPGPTIAKVKAPILVLNGDKDRQVSSAANLAVIRSALQIGGNPDATVRELAGLNHLFQTAGTGMAAEYGTITETFAPSALVLLADWVVAHVR